MVYSARHYKPRKKKNSKSLIFFIILIFLSGLGLYYKNSVLSLFLGNETKRLNRLVSKVESGLAGGNSELKDIEEFINIAEHYTASDPGNADAWHLLAKGYYYKIRFIGTISTVKLLEAAYGGGLAEFGGKYPEVIEFSGLMYGNALKARAINDRNDWNENDILVLLGETFRSVKRVNAVMDDFKKLKEPEGDLKSGYYWDGLVLALIAGDIQAFEALIKNQNLPFKFAANEEDFLKGYLYYNGKDYVRSLFLLRKSRAVDNEDIKFYSTILEARIFAMQNLPARSLEILELVYKEWPARQNIVIRQYLELKEKYPFIDSRIIALTS